MIDALMFSPCKIGVGILRRQFLGIWISLPWIRKYASVTRVEDWHPKDIEFREVLGYTWNGKPDYLEYGTDGSTTGRLCRSYFRRDGDNWEGRFLVIRQLSKAEMDLCPRYNSDGTPIK